MIEITPAYLASQGLSPTFPQRFWSKVKKTDSCWLWIGSLDTHGYGQICIGVMGRSILAHRAAWILNYGPIPPELPWVLHRCDTPACVRPAHLFCGTRQDNIDDMMQKGRYVKGRIYRGELNPSSKLTREDVLTIRAEYADRQVSQRVLAEQFGVSPMLISKIVRHKIWPQTAVTKPS